VAAEPRDPFEGMKSDVRYAENTANGRRTTLFARLLDENGSAGSGE